MEQRFSNESIDLVTLREFCEREGDPARWLAYVTEGCFKYVTHGLSDDREHITWLDKSLTLGQLQASLLSSH